MLDDALGVGGTDRLSAGGLDTWGGGPLSVGEGMTDGSGLAARGGSRVGACLRMMGDDTGEEE